MVAKDDLPYRPCVGVVLFNDDGLVWAGERRFEPDDAEGAGYWWQFPQGGIDKNEDPAEAAKRELFEETSVRSAEIIGETGDWLTYDLPDEMIGIAWKGRYRGQKQKWFAMRFTGPESEIDVDNPGDDHKPEFSAWRWERLERLPDLIVPFKRDVYVQVVAAFKHLAAG
ncbi:RNA pyrophosphohydrolase [Rhodobium gokarnense]|uniref:RNA pyrophosphohydrolase n=1 Tax=Rhodobium gokarnense TaxID=364296 RepID=A0ABT3HEI7_9HYPH|nr:RNA pyrophosphohydrolase [Rhodobium gokarnense]MCW2308812.1 putative (di)nucleoside polyphosphate hydrolase [Rhodobium gokarnense]